MSCRIHLVPLNAGGAPNGRWFLTSAPGTFDGTLSISCNNVNFTPIAGLPSDTIPLDNVCVNKHDIWVNIEGEAIGEYVFTFVSPIGADVEDCADECVDCQTFTVDAEEAVPADEASYCESDEDVYNVYTVMGISNSEFEIASVTGCTLGQPNCIAANGNFAPNDLEAGNFIVTFNRIGVEDCDDCSTELTIIIDEAGDAGDAQSATVCIIP